MVKVGAGQLMRSRRRVPLVLNRDGTSDADDRLEVVRQTVGMRDGASAAEANY